MTNRELFWFFGWEYGEGGVPKLPAVGGPGVSERDLFREHCRLNFVTDPAVVEQLWQQRVAAQPRTSKGAKAGGPPKPKLSKFRAYQARKAAAKQGDGGATQPGGRAEAADRVDRTAPAVGGRPEQ